MKNIIASILLFLTSIFTPHHVSSGMPTTPAVTISPSRMPTPSIMSSVSPVPTVESARQMKLDEINRIDIVLQEDKTKMEQYEALAGQCLPNPSSYPEISGIQIAKDDLCVKEYTNLFNVVKQNADQLELQRATILSGL